jgi:voltage-gated potassium channel
MGRWNIVERRVARFLKEPPSIREAAGVIVTATAVVVVGAGFLISLVDGEEYPNLGVGMWWALQTVTTVGYGDVVPTTGGGRFIAGIVMFFSVATVSLVTAVVTAGFVAYQQRRLSGEVERHAELLDALHRIERRLDRLER